MEYAKDMVLNLKKRKDIEENSEWKNAKKKFDLSRMFGKVGDHKIIASVVVLTLGFMVIDLILISSFIDVLGTL